MTGSLAESLKRITTLTLCIILGSIAVGCRSVTVQLDDPSATLFVNGESRGNGPAKIKLEPLTTHLLIAKKGSRVTVAYLGSDGTAQPAIGAKETPLAKAAAEDLYVMKSPARDGQAYLWPGIYAPINMVDKERVMDRERVIAITPGVHTCAAHYNDGRYASWDWAMLTFYAQSGHIYRVVPTADTRTLRVTYRVEDWTSDPGQGEKRR